MTMLQFLMGPANAVCDRCRLTDPHERGMMRMLVNMMLVTAIGIVVVIVAWPFLA